MSVGSWWGVEDEQMQALRRTHSAELLRCTQGAAVGDQCLWVSSHPCPSLPHARFPLLTHLQPHDLWLDRQLPLLPAAHQGQQSAGLEHSPGRG